MKIGIIQTGCWGDNINSTLMLKPLKDKYPDSIIELHTSDLYANAFYNNPYIDKLIEHKASSKNQALGLAIDLVKTLPQIVNREYDFLINHHPLFDQNRTSSLHPELGVNLVYSWVRALEEYDIPYELPLETRLYLTQKEVDNAREYLGTIDHQNKRKVLMEVHGESGQSYWNPHWTNRTVHHLANDDTVIFISRKVSGSDIEELKKIHKNVHFVGHLSIRECAELFNHCDVFLSVSSGLSNACNTNWCKKDIKWVEAVNSITASSAAIRQVGKDYWFDNNLDGYINCLRKNGI